MPGSLFAVAGKTEHHLYAGPAGDIDILIDAPVQTPRGIALITHPQPLLGGSPRHKIPHRLAHALRDDGWLAVRPAFRGVGRSAGQYDHGDGESEDMLALVHALRDASPTLPLALVGFSFGPLFRHAWPARSSMPAPRRNASHWPVCPWVKSPPSASTTPRRCPKTSRSFMANATSRRRWRC
ncbi:hydrolase of the alpha/beta superfamily [Bordetella holmesii 35009]|nr:hydrolase of the alpha/beta superfamily [Bordetella holmesii 35009]